MPQIPKYDLVEEDIGIPIQFTSTSAPRILTVIEIVSQFLEHIMKEVEDKIGCPPAHVAISTPNQFGQSQRLALLQAAKLSNIEPVRLVTSCMAASVCLRYYQKYSNLLDESVEEKDDNKINYEHGKLSNGRIHNDSTHKNGYNKHIEKKRKKHKNKKKKKIIFI
eukprot:282832_1